MTVRPFAAGAFAARHTADMFVGMRRELDSLQRQLATGLKSETYGGVGFERRSSLDVRGKMAMLSGYQESIEGATLRLKVMTQTMESLDAMGRDTRSDMIGIGFQIGSDGQTTAQHLAEQRLRQAIDQLNADLNGRYLFAGRSPESPPVETYERIMNGDPVAGRAGLATLINERTAAEVGFDGLGRLSTSVSSAVPSTPPFTVTLAGNGPSLPFGFQIESVSSTSPSITAGFAAGPPEQATLTVSAQPLPDTKITIVLRDKDNNAHTIEIAAKTALFAGERNAFEIGATEDATVNGTNGLHAVIRKTIEDKATAVLKPRAAILAAQEFFDGSMTNPPDRVAVAPSRLAVTQPAVDTVQLGGNLSALGFEILGTTSNTGANIVTTFTAAVAGPPAVPENVEFQITPAVPADGDKIVLQLRDRTGATHTVELTARTAPAPGDRNAFQIVAGDINQTIGGGNGLMAALTRVVEDRAAAVLGSAEATAMDTSGTRQTVIWYKGDDASTPSARDTMALRIDSSQVVGTGARANEPALRNMLAQLGVLDHATFANTAADRERYLTLTGRLRDNLAPPYGQPRVEDIATEFGAAMATMQGANERHQAAQNILQDTIDRVEQASTEETAASMLHLQTRLQASYQTTSMLSRLSIVNFL